MIESGEPGSEAFAELVAAGKCARNIRLVVSVEEGPVCAGFHLVVVQTAEDPFAAGIAVVEDEVVLLVVVEAHHICSAFVVK